MANTFALTRDVLSNRAIVPIVEQQFSTLRAAVDCLMHVLYVEEKYDFIRQNYNAFATALSGDGAQSRPSVEESYVRYAKSELNRHVVNILTTTKLYLDQSIRYANKLDRLVATLNIDLASQTSIQYEGKFGYRVMEALRNYVQHRGDAVHTAKFGLRRVSDGDSTKILAQTELYLNPVQLRLDKKFKASVLDEMEALQKMPSLQDFLQEYLIGLTSIHSYFREAVAKSIFEAEEVRSHAINAYRENSGADSPTVGLIAVEVGSDGQYVQKFGLADNLIDMRKFYEAKPLIAFSEMA